jgi:serine/threonine protein kinase
LRGLIPFPHIPGYGLEQEIGEGGFAKVYRARELGALPRTVAIKVLKRGMDTERILERFSVERRVLASLDHPNIATALAAGETEDLRPYVVMELVDGPDLVRHAQEHSLPLERRLRLFLDVCRGVQYAHQYGVIHRYLKPSNVLVAEVDGRPTPRIIDFGIAKALDPGAAEFSELVNPTLPGQPLGTPAYMSPEQLEVEADRRYQSVSALAEDIECHLAGLPIRARANSTTYLLGKSLRRHRKLILRTAASCLPLASAPAPGSGSGSAAT